MVIIITCSILDYRAFHISSLTPDGYRAQHLLCCEFAKIHSRLWEAKSPDPNREYVVIHTMFYEKAYKTP